MYPGMLVAAFLLLLARTSVCAFLPRNEDELAILSRDASHGEYRRFWNDDLEACILKYCLRHQSNGLEYMRCIRKHCPAGLVTVPRELPEAETEQNGGSLGGVSQQNGMQRICAYMNCIGSTSSEELFACIQTKCSTGPSDSPKELASPEPIMDVEEILKLDLCALEKCAGIHNSEYIDCVARRCASPEVQGKPEDDTDLFLSDLSLVRKRRVNPAMALCIDKHSTKCAGEQMERANCLRDNCNLS